MCRLIQMSLLVSLLNIFPCQSSRSLSNASGDADVAIANQVNMQHLERVAAPIAVQTTVNLGSEIIGAVDHGDMVEKAVDATQEIAADSSADVVAIAAVTQSLGAGTADVMQAEVAESGDVAAGNVDVTQNGADADGAVEDVDGATCDGDVESQDGPDEDAIAVADVGAVDSPNAEADVSAHAGDVVTEVMPADDNVMQAEGMPAETNIVEWIGTDGEIVRGLNCMFSINKGMVDAWRYADLKVVVQRLQKNYEFLLGKFPLSSRQSRAFRSVFAPDDTHDLVPYLIVDQELISFLGINGGESDGEE